MFSGKIRTMDLNVTQEQIDKYAGGGYLIQDIFPNLTPGEREFIKTGVTDEEWEEYLGPSPEEKGDKNVG